MITQTLGKTGLTVSRLSYGCMRIPGTWNPRDVTPERERAGIAAILAAVDAGYTLIDHADIYCAGEAERIFGLALKQRPALARQVVVATKCGIKFAGPGPRDPGRYDFSRSHILASCEASLKRLGIESIDVYQLHRPDVLMHPHEVAEAFAQLKRDGKVRFFGVSNFLPSTLSLLQSALPDPLVVNQVEIHLGRLACFEDGTLDQCLQHGITPLAWSPLAGGWLGEGGNVPFGDPRRHLLGLMDELAREHSVSRTCIALAWLLRHPSGIIPIVGTVRPERIADAVKSTTLTLTREQWYSLYVAARGRAMP
jgi:predicted oxidoreductase